MLSLAQMKKLDLYIIRKFLSTFFLSIILILLIVVVFDISERMEDFLDKKPPLNEIVFDFYLNYIIFIANLFSPLFTFIAVIYFTSRMAYRSEIIAIFSSGIGFNRLLFPYLFSAGLLALLSLSFNHFVLPRANKTRLVFEEKYLRNRFENRDRNIHRKLDAETYYFFSGYDSYTNIGYNFVLEKIKDGNRYYYLKGDRLKWDSVQQRWLLENYFMRRIDGMKETVVKGTTLDTVFAFHPSEFTTRENKIEAMTTPVLNEFIEQERLKGSSRIPFYEVEQHWRSSYPFATFVLTLIGVSVASRKVRGGIGWQLGLGLGISFCYILFMRISTTFATNGGLSPFLAVWLPNFIFSLVALVMLRNVPK
jgi:lipopolysaccharide export system permease protein